MVLPSGAVTVISIVLSPTSKGMSIHSPGSTDRPFTASDAGHSVDVSPQMIRDRLNAQSGDVVPVVQLVKELVDVVAFRTSYEDHVTFTIRSPQLKPVLRPSRSSGTRVVRKRPVYDQGIRFTNPGVGARAVKMNVFGPGRRITL